MTEREGNPRRPDEPRQVYEGWGDTMDAALQAVAHAAIEADARNDGAVFRIVLHEVKVANPRISEHRIVVVK